ncbi:MAG: DUF4230 domain-containing protein [Candidatus Coprovivens sp.]
MKGKTIAGLLVITSATSIGATTYVQQKRQEEQRRQELIEEYKKQIKDAEQQIKEMYTDKNILNETFKSMNKMIVARGTIETSYRFSNKCKAVMADSVTNICKNIWNRLTYKDVIFTAKYYYNVTYDFKNINVVYEDDALKIKLHETNLSIEDVRIDYKTAYVDENNGLLAKNFTSNETNAMANFSTQETENYLKTEQQIMDNAMASLENNIKDLCRKLGVENYKIEKYENNTISNKSNFLNINNYIQEGINFN